MKVKPIGSNPPKGLINGKYYDVICFYYYLGLAKIKNDDGEEVYATIANTVLWEVFNDSFKPDSYIVTGNYYDLMQVLSCDGKDIICTNGIKVTTNPVYTRLATGADMLIGVINESTN